MGLMAKREIGQTEAESGGWLLIFRQKNLKQKCAFFEV